jgi:hypothetical protein
MMKEMMMGFFPVLITGLIHPILGAVTMIVLLILTFAYPEKIFGE